MAPTDRWTSRRSLFAAIALLLVPASLWAAPVRVVSTDARGVTLELTVGAWSLTAPDAEGRVDFAPLEGAHALAFPGRPMLPAFAATLALPPGARPTVRVLGMDGEEVRDGVRPIVGGKPVFRDDPSGRLGLQPALEAVAAIDEGTWPESMVQLDAPFPFRGRRIVQLELRPFRYDAAAQRVSAPRSLTVRVDFNLASGMAARAVTTSEPDRHTDAVLESSVLNWSQGRAWRVAPTPPGRGAKAFGVAPAPFDESQPEVRVQLSETALYRLPYEELSAKGYPSGVPVAQVSVHRHEYLEGANPPYGTFELPSEVEDANTNGVFDDGDGVWLYARTWAERSNATNTRRWWGDAEVVFVTRVLTGGLRVPQRAGWNNVVGLTPLTTFPFKKRFERDFAPIMSFIQSVADTNIGLWQWTDLTAYYQRPDTIRFDAPGLDDTQNASFTVRWVGRKFENHFMWAAIKNGANQVTTVIDSVSWFGKAAIQRTAFFPGNVLTEGNTNFLRQWGKTQFAPPDPVTNALSVSGLDWFELTYQRRYEAAADYLRFNSGTAAADFQLTLDGFTTNDIRLYDVTNPEQPVRLTIAPAQVHIGAQTVSIDMQDLASPGTRREYAVAAVQSPVDPTLGPKAPPTSAYSAVTRSSLYANTTGDYLLVYPQAFAAAVPPLAALRRAQGLSVIEAPIESIYDEFGDGRHTGAAIERFTKYAYARWNSRFLMLVGDGTLDPNGVRRLSGKDWIPALPTPGPVGTGEGLEITVSDNRYGYVTGNEDPIFALDTNRVVPELMVGRLTVNSLAEANTVISKIIAYENPTAAQDWRRNVLLLADDAFSGETTFGGGTTTSGYCHRSYEELFWQLNETMRSYISSDSGIAGMNVDVFNLRSYLQVDNIGFDPVGGDTCRVSRDAVRAQAHASVTPQLLGKLNAGALLWNYQGHANEFVLTHEDIWINSGTSLGDDAQRLANDNKPFLFTAFSCHANMFARPEHQLNSGVGPCIGEDLLALPNGRGAIGSWASTCYEVVPRNNRDHINVELIRSMFVNPPRDESLGADERGARVIVGEVVLASLFRYLGTTRSYAPERGLSVTYLLLGDPATRMSIGRPLSLLKANGLTVSGPTPLRLHTAGDTLRIDADLVSNVRLDSLGVFVNTGSGDGPVPNTDFLAVSPAFPDTALGNVSGGRHFRIVYRTSPAARTTDYTIIVKDRNGLVQRTGVRLQLDGNLFSSGAPLTDGDEVAPSAALTLRLLSPRPITNPASELSLTLNGQPVVFDATPAPGDTTSSGTHSQREWILSWTHPDYAIDSYVLVLAIAGGGTVTRQFRVTAASGRLGFRDLIPFPNPFDNSGTTLSFTLLGGEPADVKLHIFTMSGRSIYTQVVRGLAPGYHQIPYDARDAEGDDLANGVYFYRLSATTLSGSSIQQQGRLVKLRRPRRIEEPVVP